MAAAESKLRPSFTRKVESSTPGIGSVGVPHFIDTLYILELLKLYCLVPGTWRVLPTFRGKLPLRQYSAAHSDNVIPTLFLGYGLSNKLSRPRHPYFNITLSAMALQALIEQKLQAELEPVHLDVINESGMHNAPPGAESHFKVVVVSKKFEGE